MAVCAFCGQQFKGKTKDHVPPRGLFGENPKGNLITVPACVKCNNDTSKDDEFFRLIALELNASEHPIARQVSDTTYKSIFHPKKEGYKTLVFNMLEPVEPATPEELSGTAPDDATRTKLMRMTLPVARLLMTVRKTIKGLFYAIKKYPLPADYAVKGYLLDMLLQGLPQPQRNELVNDILPALRSQPTTQIGEGVFTYQSVRVGDDVNQLYFLLNFYHRFNFFGFTCPSSIGDEGR